MRHHFNFPFMKGSGLPRPTSSALTRKMPSALFLLLEAGVPLCYTEDLVTLFSRGLQLHYKHFAHLRMEPVDENSFLMFAVVWKNRAFIQLKAVMMKGKILFSTLLPLHISKMRQ